jgi:hypothetical protein
VKDRRYISDQSLIFDDIILSAEKEEEKGNNPKTST